MWQKLESLLHLLIPGKIGYIKFTASGMGWTGGVKVKESRDCICLKFLLPFWHFVHVACYQLKLDMVHEKSCSWKELGTKDKKWRTVWGQKIWRGNISLCWKEEGGGSIAQVTFQLFLQLTNSFVVSFSLFVLLVRCPIVLGQYPCFYLWFKHISHICHSNSFSICQIHIIGIWCLFVYYGFLS